MGRLTLSKWYELLNSMVFFWPTKKRLETMLSASAYRNLKHDVLVVDARELVRLEAPNIRLSRMNSGCTKPFADQRDIGLFKTFRSISGGESTARQTRWRRCACWTGWRGSRGRWWRYGAEPQARSWLLLPHMDALTRCWRRLLETLGRQALAASG